MLLKRESAKQRRTSFVMIKASKNIVDCLKKIQKVLVVCEKGLFFRCWIIIFQCFQNVRQIIQHFVCEEWISHEELNLGLEKYVPFGGAGRLVHDGGWRYCQGTQSHPGSMFAVHKKSSQGIDYLSKKKTTPKISKIMNFSEHPELSKSSRRCQRCSLFWPQQPGRVHLQWRSLCGDGMSTVFFKHCSNVGDHRSQILRKWIRVEWGYNERGVNLFWLQRIFQ